MRRFLFIMALCGVAFSQVSYNHKVHNLALSNFASDTLRMTDKFAAGDYEGVDIIILANSVDSAKFIVGYQRGYPVWGYTIWERPWVAFDTFDVAGATVLQSQDSMFYAASGDTDLVAGIDTLQLSGYGVMVRHLEAFRSPFARIVVKGLTGNSVAPYNLYFAVCQPRYFRVDVGPGKQPE